MGFLIFDIETRIDKALLNASLFRGEGLSDEQACERMRAQLRAETEGRSDFFPLPFHVPVSVVLGQAGRDYALGGISALKAEVLGERGIVSAFWERIESFDGTLVSFNGRTFDLPVMELQALRHGVPAPRYYNDRNGFRARFGSHYDLYDFMCNGGAVRLRGGFDVLARLAGLPGKGETTGADVQRLWEEGRAGEIHRYCAEDVVQTYLLLLHVESLRGRIATERRRQLEAEVRTRRAELLGGDEVPPAP
jgi:predicted PolB exonuclease-like 3'-5' exonuclease